MKKSYKKAKKTLSKILFYDKNLLEYVHPFDLFFELLNMSKKNISTESFITSRKFYDDKNYPRGMRRSGDYSITEVTILEEYGVALSAIASGALTPVTEEEFKFKSVCQGECKATSAIEKSWLKYQNKILSPKQFHTLFGGSKTAPLHSEIEPEIDSNLDDLDN